MKKCMCVLAFLAVASMAMAVAPVASVAINNVPGTPNPQYLLQSITVGADTFGISTLATGTSTGNPSAGNIAFMDDLDLNTLTTGNNVPLKTVLFAGVAFVDTNGSKPDFFLFEASASANPDDISIAPIFMDDTLGTAIALPTIVDPAGWGNTGLTMAGQQNGQAITGIAWDITDLKDANGNFLASGSTIKGIAITAGPGIDPCGFFAVVPEPATMIMLSMGGLALLRKRS
jgi:hypothetical protein